jgi:hypothetical protein
MRLTVVISQVCSFDITFLQLKRSFLQKVAPAPRYKGRFPKLRMPVIPTCRGGGAPIQRVTDLCVASRETRLEGDRSRQHRLHNSAARGDKGCGQGHNGKRPRVFCRNEFEMAQNNAASVLCPAIADETVRWRGLAPSRNVTSSSIIVENLRRPPRHGTRNVIAGNIWPPPRRARSYLCPDACLSTPAIRRKPGLWCSTVIRSRNSTSNRLPGSP